MKNDFERIESIVNDETRRSFLGRSCGLVGGLGLSSLLRKDLMASSNQGLPNLPHFAPKAKRVIYLFMAGGPSHVDLFDYKPVMKKLDGTELPDSVRNGQRVTGMTSGQKKFTCIAPRYKMERVGDRGTWMNTQLLPHMSKIADKLTIIRSMNTEAINHDPAITYINTGTQMFGRPSLGAWVSYGLGSLNENFPSYITMISVGDKPGQALYARLWGSGFLPSQHQGVQFRSGKEPVLYLNNPNGITNEFRGKLLDNILNLNKERHKFVQDPEIEARISQYEMAYRMQTSVPDLMDTKGESDSVFEQYGPDSRKKGSFASNCILARKLAEKDVRFIQLFHRGWDHHFDVPKRLPINCKSIDQPVAALISDLESRGMLEDTMIIFGGEFGRTIYAQKPQKDKFGRDHHGRCFTTLVAGGGFKSGIDYGQTDDYAWNIVKDPVHINDLNATVLHNLGIDHKRFRVKHQGLDLGLTGVEPRKVVKDIIL